MGHEQTHEAARAAGVDSEGLHLRRHRFSLTTLQHLERLDHFPGPGKIGTAPICAVLAPPRIPTDDHACEYPQYDLRRQSREKKSDSRLLPVVPEQRPVDDATNDSREKYDERI